MTYCKNVVLHCVVAPIAIGVVVPNRKDRKVVSQKSTIVHQLSSING